MKKYSSRLRAAAAMDLAAAGFRALVKASAPLSPSVFGYAMGLTFREAEVIYDRHQKLMRRRRPVW